MQNTLKDFKLLTLDEILISLDRLTRFKHPDLSYPRVFRDIIHKTSLSAHISDKNLDELSPEEISKYISKVWKESIKKYSENSELDDLSDKILKKIPLFCFEVKSEYTKALMKTKLFCAEILLKIEDKKLPKNLRIVKFVLNEILNGKQYSDDLIIQTSEKYKLLFPIRKLVIVEGITEDILLPTFADFINTSLSERGVYIFSAGGKTKIPSLYAELKNELKIPVTVVFDNDAKNLSDDLTQVLRKEDNIIVNSKGEFEDLLSLNLIKRTLNSTYYNSEKSTLDELRSQKSMCKSLEEYYRIRNLGEFKKAQFAKLLAENIKYSSDISEDIKKLIEEII